MNKTQNSFIKFFTSFPKLFLAGLIFSAIFSASIGVFALLAKLVGFNNIIIIGLGIIPAMPFYAGLVMIIRKISIEKKDIKVFNTFFKAVKENFKAFLIHGVILYAIVACSFFALLYYYTLAQDDVVFGSVLMLYVIFTVLMLVMMFYVPIMTITYELRLRDIYKNSFLLIFGKVLRNLIALILLGVVSALAFLALIFSEGIVFYLAIAIIVALYPMLASYIVNSVIAKGLQDSVGSFVAVNNVYIPTEEEIAYEQAVVENDTSDSDYVFVNGKMIKKNKK